MKFLSHFEFKFRTSIFSYFSKRYSSLLERSRSSIKFLGTEPASSRVTTIPPKGILGIRSLRPTTSGHVDDRRCVKKFNLKLCRKELFNTDFKEREEGLSY